MADTKKRKDNSNKGFSLPALPTYPEIWKFIKEDVLKTKYYQDKPEPTKAEVIQAVKKINNPTVSNIKKEVKKIVGKKNLIKKVKNNNKKEVKPVQPKNNNKKEVKPVQPKNKISRSTESLANTEAQLERESKIENINKSMSQAKEAENRRKEARNKPDMPSNKKDKSKMVSTTDTNSSKKEGIGKQLARALSGGQKKTKVGNVTIDSTDRGMSKFMGTDKEIAEQEMDEEMNFRKGGAVKKKYGMREGGFTKRGGMYKKGY